MIRQNLIILTKEDLRQGEKHERGLSAYDFNISLDDINKADNIIYYNGIKTVFFKIKSSEYFNLLGWSQ